MAYTATTHINFRGQAREALEFYHSALGGDLVLVSNRDFGVPVEEAELDQIKFGKVSDGSFSVMAYDVPSAEPWERGTASFFLALSADTEDAARKAWSALEDGASVATPLAPAPWAPLYGMLTDRFGVTWVVDLAVPQG